MRKTLSLLLALAMVVTGLIVVPNVHAVTGVTFEHATYTTNEGTTFSSGVVSDGQIQFGFPPSNVMPGGKLDFSVTVSDNALSATNDFTATLYIKNSDGVQLAEKSVTFQLSSTVQSTTINFDDVSVPSSYKTVNVNIVVHNDTTDAVVASWSAAMWSPSYTWAAPGNKLALPTKATYGVGEQISVKAEDLSIPYAFYDGYIALVDPSKNYQPISKITMTDGLAAGVINYAKEGKLYWAVVDKAGFEILLNPVKVYWPEVIISKPKKLDPNNAYEVNVQLTATVNTVYGDTKPDSIDLVYWDQYGNIVAVHNVERSATITGHENTAYYITTDSMPPSAVYMTVRLHPDSNAIVGGVDYGKVYLDTDYIAQFSYINTELISNGQDQTIKIIVSSNSGAVLENAIVSYDLFFGGSYVNIENVIANTNDNGELLITIPGSYLEKKDHPAFVTVNINYVYDYGHLYLGDSKTLPIIQPEGLGVNFNVTPGRVGTNKFDVYVTYSSDYTGGLYAKVYFAVPEGYDDAPFKSVPDGVDPVDYINKHQDDYFIGSQPLSGHSAEIIKEINIPYGMSFPMYVVVKITDQYSNVVATQLKMVNVTITGWKYEASITDQEIHVGDTVTPTIRITDENGTPINNASLFITAKDLYGNSIKLVDVFGEPSNSDIVVDDYEWVISSRDMNVVNGVYDLAKAAGEDNLSAKESAVIYVSVYDNKGILQIATAKWFTIMPSESMALDVKALSKIIPGTPVSLQLTATGHSFVIDKIVADDKNAKFSYYPANGVFKDSGVISFVAEPGTYTIYVIDINGNGSAKAEIEVKPVTITVGGRFINDISNNIAFTFTFDNEPITISKLHFLGMAYYGNVKSSQYEDEVMGPSKIYQIAGAGATVTVEAYVNEYKVGETQIVPEKLHVKVDTGVAGVIELKENTATTATIDPTFKVYVGGDKGAISGIAVIVNGVKYYTNTNGYTEEIPTQNNNSIMIDGIRTLTYYINASKINIQSTVTITLEEPKVANNGVINVNEQSLKLIGHITVTSNTDDKIKSFTINGVPVPVAANGVFYYTVPLQSGTNAIVMEAKSELGATGTYTIYAVFKPETNVMIFLNTPMVANGGTVTVNNDTIHIAGRVMVSSNTNDELAEVHVNGKLAALSVNGMFEYDLKLVPGANKVKIEAITKGGLIAEYTFTVNFDAYANVNIVMISPEFNDQGVATVAEDSITLKGKLIINTNMSDYKVVRVVVNGEDAVMQGEYFTKEIKNLKEGNNEVKITVYDSLNQSYDYNYSIYYDKQSKIIKFLKQVKLVIVEPQELNNAPVYITYKKHFKLQAQVVAPEAPTEIKINGKAVANIYGLFTYETDLVEGNNTFTIVASFSNGAEKTFTITVIYHKAEPKFEVADATTTDGAIWTYETDQRNGIISMKIQYSGEVSVIANGVIVPMLDDVAQIAYRMPEDRDTMAIMVYVTTDDGNTYTVIINVKYNPYLHKDEIKLQIGSRHVYVNGEEHMLDVAPFIDKAAGRTMVPLRFIAEVLGYEVKWDGNTRTITIKDADNYIIFLMDKKGIAKTAVVNNQVVVLDAPARIVNGRTFVPIRFVAETFGLEVQWDGKTRTVTLIRHK